MMRFSVTMSEEQYEQLNAYSELFNLKGSAVIREALAKYLPDSFYYDGQRTSVQDIQERINNGVKASPRVQRYIIAAVNAHGIVNPDVTRDLLW